MADSDAVAAVIEALRNAKPQGLDLETLTNTVPDADSGISEGEVRDAVAELERDERIERLPEEGQPDEFRAK